MELWKTDAAITWSGSTEQNEMNIISLYRQLRAKMALKQFKDILLRTMQKGTIAIDFWFSTEHLWTSLPPFWLSTDDIYSGLSF